MFSGAQSRRYHGVRQPLAHISETQRRLIMTTTAPSAPSTADLATTEDGGFMHFLRFLLISIVRRNMREL